jgi:SAM-dependent MidA family methyltransferase
MASPDDPSARIAAVLRALDSAADPTGFVPFDRLMEIALYDPAAGYYAATRSPLGAAGDFYTAAHVTPLFAHTVAGKVRAVRRTFPDDEPFRIVELGPGDGTLAAGIAGALGAEAGRFEYAIVERSDARAYETEERLTAANGRLSVRRLASVGAEGPFRGVVIANEYLDALPARRLRWSGTEWNELGVERTGTAPRAAERPASRPVPGAPLPTPEEAGVVLEVSPAAEATVREIADHLTAGSALLIDYGLEESELLIGHPHGTLAAVRGHRAVDDPLDAPGTADLSVFVNFTRVRAAGRASGLREVAFRSQAEALGEWGFPALLDAEVKAAGSVEAEVRVRLAAKNLLFGFERFRVLELAPPVRTTR